MSLNVMFRYNFETFNVIICKDIAIFVIISYTLNCKNAPFVH